MICQALRYLIVAESNLFPTLRTGSALDTCYVSMKWQTGDWKWVARSRSLAHAPIIRVRVTIWHANAEVIFMWYFRQPYLRLFRYCYFFWSWIANMQYSQARNSTSMILCSVTATINTCFRKCGDWDIKELWRISFFFSSLPNTFPILQPPITQKYSNKSIWIVQGTLGIEIHFGRADQTQ
jgi:hypothetical protein